ncbi:Endochitinase At2g43610 [Linum perenne]
MGKIQLLTATLAVFLAAAVIPTTVVEAVAVGSVVTPSFFNSILSQAGTGCKGKRFYTRASFLAAARSYPRFGNLDTNLWSKREIAAFFAQITHETGRFLLLADLCYVEEIARGTYCSPSSTYPCVPGKKYYGRGPIQLTWNYNYGACGKANNFNGLKDPDIVARSPTIAWKTGLWFWMKNVRPVVKRGFGATIRRINGGECNGGSPSAVAARVKYYRAYCRAFGITPGPNLSC